MGFFSDLKDDLSQAVNELLPSEGEEEVKKETVEQVQPAADTATSASIFAQADTEAAVEQEEVFIDNSEMPVASDDLIVEDLDAEDFSGDRKEDFIADSTADFDANTAADFGTDFSSDFSQMFGREQETKIPEQEPVYTPPIAERKMPDLSRPSSKSASGEVSVLTESMIINGNIATEGALEVRGRIVGNVEALGKLNITGEVQGNSQAAEIYAEGARITGELRSHGSIKIGQNAVVLGNVYANSAVVAGAVRGDLDIRGPVILDTSAIVMGDIKSKSVQINNGAVIEGMCSQCYAEVNPTSFFEELKKMK
ncbi:MAG: polymer-forming cytoskeletal protein [Lachnospiraceae bacterium]|nr:polymer-forming cytoskeletal protein [Lachnospiraceae bacterium]MDE6185456.1 polymer-forming cytoskeletal protein [Lachnospiraceae bacterium]